MTFGSLFSGIGGIDLGLERAGMECKWQCEIDPFCRDVLNAQWPQVPQYGDITKLSGRELEQVDLICGGFPCQDLSVAGKRTGIEGSRSGLWFEFARLIGELRPRYVLAENVPGLLIPHRDGERVSPAGISRVVGELARLGYVGCWRCLRASEFGASHLRKRVFIVGVCRDNPVGRLGLPCGRRRSAVSRAMEMEASLKRLCLPDDKKRKILEEPVHAPFNLPSEGWRGNGSREQKQAGQSQAQPPISSALGELSQQGNTEEQFDWTAWCDEGEGPEQVSGAFLRERGVENTREFRYSGRSGSGIHEGIEGEPVHVAHRTQGGRGELRESSRGGGQPDGSEPELADSGDGQFQEPGRGAQGRDGTGSASAVLPCFAPGYSARLETGRDGDSGDAHLRDLRDGIRGGHENALPDLPDDNLWNRDLPCFAPGPSDPRWPDIIRDYPWLAPALETPSKCGIRDLADGLSGMVDASGLIDRAMKNRTRALKALGNAVVPQVAEWIGRRIMEVERSLNPQQLPLNPQSR